MKFIAGVGFGVLVGYFVFSPRDTMERAGRNVGRKMDNFGDNVRDKFDEVSGRSESAASKAQQTIREKAEDLSDAAKRTWKEVKS